MLLSADCNDSKPHRGQEGVMRLLRFFYPRSSSSLQRYKRHNVVAKANFSALVRMEYGKSNRESLGRFRSVGRFRFLPEQMLAD